MSVTEMFGVGWSFAVEIGSISIGQITKVEGIKLEADVMELKTNDLLGQYMRKKLPGRMKSGTVTITRATPVLGVTGGLTTTYFADWIKQVFQGQMTEARRTCHIYVLPYGGPLGVIGAGIGGATMKFVAVNCWPTAIDYGNFQAGDNNPLTEKITLHHEGLYQGDPSGQNY